MKPTRISQPRRGGTETVRVPGPARADPQGASPLGVGGPPQGAVERVRDQSRRRGHVGEQLVGLVGKLIEATAGKGK